MTDVVFDANTLASGSVASEGTIALLIEAFLADRFRVFLSQHIFRELRRALTKPYFSLHLTAEEIGAYLQVVRDAAVEIEILTEVRGVATHPEDDLVLATAVSAGASYLVTGDRKLQDLGNYEGVAIVSPRRFLDLLQSGELG